MHLKKRFEFLKVTKSGTSVAKPSFVFQFLVSETPERDLLPLVRVGFTASKKVGNAIKRNRAKRRLRALVQKHLPLIKKTASSSTDLVFIARSRTIDLPFQRLERDMEEVLQAMGRLKK